LIQFILYTINAFRLPYLSFLGNLDKSHQNLPIIPQTKKPAGQRYQTVLVTLIIGTWLLLFITNPY